MFNTRWKSTTKCIEWKQTASIQFPPLFAVLQSSFNALHCLWSLPVIRSNGSCTSEPQHIVLPLFGDGEEGVVPIPPPGETWQLSAGPTSGNSPGSDRHPCTDGVNTHPPSESSRLTLPLCTVPGSASRDGSLTPTSVRCDRKLTRDQQLTQVELN